MRLVLLEHRRSRAGLRATCAANSSGSVARRDRARGLVPLLQDFPALFRRQDIKPARSAGRALDSGQKPQEPLLKVGKPIATVRGRIAVEIDPKVATIRSIIQNDGEIFDRTSREVVRL